ncbi:EndoU domain-containing protein [Kitasatospora purpeofusca]|uniref:EndoU domain-containing protein n=1 Tax=Kitasatospora purpeofusca TaxID=67352 RepID=UPI00366652A6
MTDWNQRRVLRTSEDTGTWMGDRPLSVARVLFDSGQEGLRITVPVRTVVEGPVTPEYRAFAEEQVQQRVNDYVRDRTLETAGPDGVPPRLVAVVLDFTPGRPDVFSGVLVRPGSASDVSDVLGPLAFQGQDQVFNAIVGALDGLAAPHADLVAQQGAPRVPADLREPGPLRPGEHRPAEVAGWDQQTARQLRNLDARFSQEALAAEPRNLPVTHSLPREWTALDARWIAVQILNAHDSRFGSTVTDVLHGSYGDVRLAVHVEDGQIVLVTGVGDQRDLPQLHVPPLGADAAVQPAPAPVAQRRAVSAWQSADLDGTVTGTPRRPPAAAPGEMRVTLPNGTVRVFAAHLDPAVAHGAPAMQFPSRWHRSALDPGTVYYPEHWSEAQLTAHVTTALDHPLLTRQEADGSRVVLGRADGVWIEGRFGPDGELYYHRPAPHQSFDNPDYQDPASTTAHRGTEVRPTGLGPVRVRRDLMFDGSEVLRVTARVRLVGGEHATPADLRQAETTLRQAAAEYLEGHQPASGTPLDLRLEFTRDRDATEVRLVPGQDPTIEQALPRLHRAAGTDRLAEVLASERQPQAPSAPDTVSGETMLDGRRRLFTAAVWDRPTEGRNLPREWTPDEARYAASVVAGAAHRVPAGPVPPGGTTAPELVHGSFAGVRLTVRVENGRISDFWGQPDQRMPDQLTRRGPERIQVLGSREVHPPTDRLELSMEARDAQRFAVSRIRFADGDTESLVTVRVHLDTSALDLADPATARGLGDLVDRARAGMAATYGGTQRLPGGDRLRVRVEFVNDPGAAHHTVAVHPVQDREDHHNWGLDTRVEVIVHEMGHTLGLPDEYREGSYEGRVRPVHEDGGLMGSFSRDRFHRPMVDNDNLPDPLGRSDRQPVLKARNLRQLGAVIDLAFGADRGPSPDGVHPPRPRVNEDARRTALYGDLDGTGGRRLSSGGRDGGGHLVPPPGSDRPRPTRIPDSENRNGTFRVYGGPADGAATGQHRLAGDLAAAPAGRDRGRTVFPEHWTGDDAVYAAEQAYQHALRRGGDAITELGPVSWAFTGEYGGVRVEGRVDVRTEQRPGGPVEVAEIVSFRPSEDQSGLGAAAHLPWHPFPDGFGQRVEDLVRYGDRHAMTGVHHQPPEPPEHRPGEPSAVERAGQRRGIRIGAPFADHPNGTYRAPVWFLDPLVSPDAWMTDFPSRWHMRADHPTNTFYPRDWPVVTVLEAVRTAYENRTDTRLVNGAQHWTGEADGVRIEGITRDGRHLVHRPADEQPGVVLPPDAYRSAPLTEPAAPATGRRPATTDPTAPVAVPADRVSPNLSGTAGRGLPREWTAAERLYAAHHGRPIGTEEPVADGFRSLVRFAGVEITVLRDVDYRIVDFSVADGHTPPRQTSPAVPERGPVRPAGPGDAAPPLLFAPRSAGSDGGSLPTTPGGDGNALPRTPGHDGDSRPTTPGDDGNALPRTPGWPTTPGGPSTPGRDESGLPTTPGRPEDMDMDLDLYRDSDEEMGYYTDSTLDFLSDHDMESVHGSDSDRRSMDTDSRRGTDTDTDGGADRVRPAHRAPAPDLRIAQVLRTAEVEAPADRALHSSTATHLRGFRAGRAVLVDGSPAVEVLVRVHLDTTGLPAGQDHTEPLADLRARARRSVDDYYNTGHRLPDGDLMVVRLEFTDDPDAAHHRVEVLAPEPGTPIREHSGLWGLDTNGTVLAHELGHLLGLPDEYRERRLHEETVDQDGNREVVEQGIRPRPSYTDAGLMGGTHAGNNRVRFDQDAGILTDGTDIRFALQPRNLRELGAVIEQALGPVRALPNVHELPRRASFDLDARQTSLFGGTRNPGGHLLPPAGSDRPAPERVVRIERNGVVVAEFSSDAALPPSRRVATSAGDLLGAGDPLTTAGPAQRRMFPRNWTSEDAVYAAEQAYLHALGTDQVVPLGGARRRWTGEYAGVRIEGEVRGDRFLSFRPADSQPDTDPPRNAPHRPDPPALTEHDPARSQNPAQGFGAFGQRAEDLARYGDRQHLTGLHHELAPDLSGRENALRAHGARVVESEAPAHNGTYRARVAFLDPTVAPNSPLAEFPTRWRVRDSDDGLRTMYPRTWSSSDLLTRVDEAHDSVPAERRVHLDDGRTYYWTGEADGVRIEGLSRDGAHLAHRPTEDQPTAPLRAWDDRRVRHTVRGEDVELDGRALTVSRVLFDSGQLGLEVTLRVQVSTEGGLTRREQRAAEGELQRRVDAYVRERVRDTADPDGLPETLVAVRLDFADEHRDPYARVIVDRDSLPDPEDLALVDTAENLQHLLGPLAHFDGADVFHETAVRLEERAPTRVDLLTDLRATEGTPRVPADLREPGPLRPGEQRPAVTAGADRDTQRAVEAMDFRFTRRAVDLDPHTFPADRSLPREWTARDARWAVTRLVEQHQVGPRETSVVIGDFRGVLLEVSVVNGRITGYRGIGDQRELPQLHVPALGEQAPSHTSAPVPTAPAALPHLAPPDGHPLLDAVADASPELVGALLGHHGLPPATGRPELRRLMTTEVAEFLQRTRPADLPVEALAAFRPHLAPSMDTALELHALRHDLAASDGTHDAGLGGALAPLLAHALHIRLEVTDQQGNTSLHGPDSETVVRITDEHPDRDTEGQDTEMQSQRESSPAGTDHGDDLTMLVDPAETELAHITGAREVRAPVDAFGRSVSAARLRGYEARRGFLEDGEPATEIVVRIHIRREQGEMDSDLDSEDGYLYDAPVEQFTDEQIGEVIERTWEGVNAAYNTGHRLPNGDLLRVRPEFVEHSADVNHHVHIVDLFSRPLHENNETWSLESTPDTLAHEIGHLLGLTDEYRRQQQRQAVYTDAGMMGSYRVEHGRISADQLAGIGPQRVEGVPTLAARNLRELGAAIDEVFGTQPSRLTPTLRAPDGHPLPPRAAFDLDSRQTSLFGDRRTEGGHLLPAPGSDRRRPTGIVEQHPNGVLHVEYGAAPDGPRRTVTEVRTSASAGDLLTSGPAPAAGPTRRRLFPRNWTEDEAVYAAEQAYLDALRHSAVTPAGPGRYRWTGEYAGVRIEGEIHGEVQGDRFASFRPADTQPDPQGLPAPAHRADPSAGPRRAAPWDGLSDLGPLPPRGEDLDHAPSRPTGLLRYGQRAQDVSRYGDRQSLTGLHQEFTPTGEDVDLATWQRQRGVEVIERGTVHPNGTYPARVRFLDATVAPDAPLAEFRNHWFEPRGTSVRTMFPRAWSRTDVLQAVEAAHARPLHQVRIDERTYRWIGEVNGVRIEGLSRNGQHLAYRPTGIQPGAHTEVWNRQQVIATGPTRPVAAGTGQIQVQRVLFNSGQQGVDIVVPLHVGLTGGVTEQQVRAFTDQVTQQAQQVWGQANAGRQPWLVNVTVVPTAGPAGAFRSIGAQEAAGISAPALLGGLLPGYGWNGAGSPLRQLFDLAGPVSTFSDRVLPTGGPEALREPGPRRPGEQFSPAVPQFDVRTLRPEFTEDAWRDPRGRNLPREWSADDIRSAAGTVLDRTRRTTGQQPPADGVVTGTAGGVTVHVRREGGRIAEVWGEPGQEHSRQHSTPVGEGVTVPLNTVRPDQEPGGSQLLRALVEDDPRLLRQLFGEEEGGRLAADPASAERALRQLVQQRFRENPELAREAHELYTVWARRLGNEPADWQPFVEDLQREITAWHEQDGGGAIDPRAVRDAFAVLTATALDLRVVLVDVGDNRASLAEFGPANGRRTVLDHTEQDGYSTVAAAERRHEQERLDRQRRDAEEELERQRREAEQELTEEDLQRIRTNAAGKAKAPTTVDESDGAASSAVQENPVHGKRAADDDDMPEIRRRIKAMEDAEAAKEAETKGESSGSKPSKPPVKDQEEPPPPPKTEEESKVASKSEIEEEPAVLPKKEEEPKAQSKSEIEELPPLPPKVEPTVVASSSRTDEPAPRQPPRTVTESGVLSGSHMVTGIGEPSSVLVVNVAARIAEVLPEGTANRQALARTLAETLFSDSALRAQVSALSRGEVVHIPVGTDARQGTVTVRGEVADLVHRAKDKAKEKFEYEGGSDRVVTLGTTTGGRKRLGLGLQGRLDFFKLFRVQGSGGVQGDLMSWEGLTTRARFFSRSKTTERTEMFDGHLRLEVGYQPAGRRGTEDLSLRLDPAAANVVTTPIEVGIPQRETRASADDLDPAHLAWPDTFDQARRTQPRLHLSHVMLDVHAEGPPRLRVTPREDADGNVEMQPVNTPPGRPLPRQVMAGVVDLLAGNDEVRDALGSNRRSLSDRLVAEFGYQRLQQDFKGMTNGESVVLRIPGSDVRIEVKAANRELNVLALTKETEFNTGAGDVVTRIRRKVVSGLRQLQGGGRLGLDDRNVSASYGGRKGSDSIHISGRTLETAVTTKTKEPGAILDGHGYLEVVVHKGDRRLGDPVEIPVGFRTVMPQSDLVTRPQHDEATAAAAVARLVENRLPESTVVRDIGSVDDLRTNLETAGKEYYGSLWPTVRDEVMQLVTQPALASRLSAMTRGEQFELNSFDQSKAGVLKDTVLGRNLKVTVTATLADPQYLRQSASADLSRQNETSTFSSERRQSGKHKVKQGGVAFPVVADQPYGNTDLGSQERTRVGTRDSAGDKLYANSKIRDAQDIFGGRVTLTVTLEGRGAPRPVAGDFSTEFSVRAPKAELSQEPHLRTHTVLPRNQLSASSVVSFKDLPDGRSGGTQVLTDVRAALKKRFAARGGVSRQLERVLAEELGPRTLQANLSQLTRGGVLKVPVGGPGWSAEVIVRARLREAPVLRREVNDAEIEVGTQNRTGHGVSYDERERITGTVGLTGKPGSDGKSVLTVDYSYRHDSATGIALETAGSTVNRAKNVSRAAVSDADVRFEVEIRGWTGGLIPSTTKLREIRAEAEVITPQYSPVEAPRAVPDRIWQTHRLGSSDVVTNVFVPEARGNGAASSHGSTGSVSSDRNSGAGHANENSTGGNSLGVDSLATNNTSTNTIVANSAHANSAGGNSVNGNTGTGTRDFAEALLRSPGDPGEFGGRNITKWLDGLGRSGLRQKLYDTLTPNTLHDQLKAMMSGRELVVSDGGVTVRIGASVRTLTHTGSTTTTEFNTGTQTEHTHSAADGATGGGAGSGHQLRATLGVNGGAWYAGGALTGSTGHDTQETWSNRAGSGNTTKVKPKNASIFSGEADLHFRVEWKEAVGTTPPFVMATKHAYFRRPLGMETVIDIAETRAQAPVGATPNPGNVFDSATAPRGAELRGLTDRTAPDNTVRIPPDRVWTHGLVDTDVVRTADMGPDARQQLTAGAKEFLGADAWDRIRGMVDRMIDPVALASRLSTPLTPHTPPTPPTPRAPGENAGQAAAKPEPTLTDGPGNSTLLIGPPDLAGGVRVEVRVKVKQLEFVRTDAESESNPTNTTSVTDGANTQRTVQAALRFTGGAKGEINEHVGGRGGGYADGAYQYRTDLATGEGGQVVNNAKIKTDTARYRGFAEVEVVYHKDGKVLPRKELMAIEIDIPVDKVKGSTDVPSGGYLRFDEGTPDGELLLHGAPTTAVRSVADALGLDPAAPADRARILGVGHVARELLAGSLTTEGDRAVRWLRGLDRMLVLAGDESNGGAFEHLRRVRDGLPVAAEDRRRLQGLAEQSGENPDLSAADLNGRWNAEGTHRPGDLSLREPSAGPDPTIRLAADARSTGEMNRLLENVRQRVLGAEGDAPQRMEVTLNVPADRATREADRLERRLRGVLRTTPREVEVVIVTTTAQVRRAEPTGPEAEARPVGGVRSFRVGPPSRDAGEQVQQEQVQHEQVQQEQVQVQVQVQHEQVQQVEQVEVQQGQVQQVQVQHEQVQQVQQVEQGQVQQEHVQQEHVQQEQTQVEQIPPVVQVPSGQVPLRQTPPPPPPRRASAEELPHTSEDEHLTSESESDTSSLNGSNDDTPDLGPVADEWMPGFGASALRNLPRPSNQSAEPPRNLGADESRPFDNLQVAVPEGLTHEREATTDTWYTARPYEGAEDFYLHPNTRVGNDSDNLSVDSDLSAPAHERETTSGTWQTARPYEGPEEFYRHPNTRVGNDSDNLSVDSDLLDSGSEVSEDSWVHVPPPVQQPVQPVQPPVPPPGPNQPLPPNAADGPPRIEEPEPMESLEDSVFSALTQLLGGGGGQP